MERWREASSKAVVLGQPVLLGAALILQSWADDATDLRVIIRPLVVTTLAIVMFALVLRLVSRSWPVSILLTNAMVAFTFREFLMTALALAALAGWAAFRLLRAVLRRPAPPQFARTILRATGVAISVLFVLATVDVGRAVATAQPEHDLPDYELEPEHRPDIYVLLLDGYPRGDTLSETFGIDNTAFEAALEDLGFAVADSARSNYNKTWLTMASMLNGTYLDELLDGQTPPREPAAQLRWLHAFINQASIPAALEAVGYTTKTIASPYTSSTIASADEVVSGPGPNDFEQGLIGPSPWTTLFREQVGSVLFDGQADRVVESLDRTVKIVEEERDEPLFLFAHVHSPHPPFVLHDDPEQDADVAECYPIGCYFFEVRLDAMGISHEEYGRRLAQQLSGLNRMVTSALSKIVAADPDAVVIVMSDHGLRYSPEDIDEHYRTFLAARTPGHADLFRRDESPVNYLRVVLDAYLGTDLERLPYRAWLLDWYENLELEEFHPDVSGLRP